MITLRAKIVLFSTIANCALGAGSDTFSGAVATTDPNWRPAGAYLTLRSVLQLAETEASNQGMPISAFEATEFSYRCQNGSSCEWFIFYVGKKITSNGQVVAQLSMRPIVTVDDRTRQVHIMGPPPFVDIK
jgi:hypothetical protein